MGRVKDSCCFADSSVGASTGLWVDLDPKGPDVGRRTQYDIPCNAAALIEVNYLVAKAESGIGEFGGAGGVWGHADSYDSRGRGRGQGEQRQTNKKRLLLQALHGGRDSNWVDAEGIA